MAEAGSKLTMMAGTMDTWDGINSYSQMTLIGKTDVKIMCEDRGTPGACTWKGASGKRLVYLLNNDGTITVGFVTIRDGDVSNVCSRNSTK